MKVPIRELKDLEERMRYLANVNENDMKEYLMKNKYDLYLSAKAQRNINEFWAHRVADIINKYEDIEDEDSDRD